MGVHHPYRLDLCADDEDPSQLIIRPGWDAPHVRCFPRTFYAWPCLLRQVGMVLGSPYDYVVAGLAYANPGSRQTLFNVDLFFRMSHGTRGQLGRNQGHDDPEGSGLPPPPTMAQVLMEIEKNRRDSHALLEVIARNSTQ